MTIMAYDWQCQDAGFFQTRSPPYRHCIGTRYFSNPDLLDGPIPAELGVLTNLDFLNLQLNQLSGAIPGALGGLVNLEALILEGNQLSGTIPAQLGNLTKLTRLRLVVMVSVKGPVTACT